MTERNDDPVIVRDEYGIPIEAGERMQQIMLALYDTQAECAEAGFPDELIENLAELRLRYMDVFERRFPGYGKGRALWALAATRRLRRW